MKRNTKGFRKFTLTLCTVAMNGTFVLASSSVAFGQDPQRPDSYDSSSGVPADKPAKAAPTAADRDITQKIRKAIAADKSISAEGRRVKIATQGGKVTLAGTAQSEAERTSIFTKAADLAGGTNVVNNITVAGQK